MEPALGSGSEPPLCGREALRRMAFLRLIDAERLHRRPVAELEQDRVLAERVLVPMFVPRRNHEEVALRPLEPLAINNRDALSAKDVIRHRAVVAMVSSFIARHQ